MAAGFEHSDALAAVIEAAHVQGLEVQAWVPQFHDRAAVQAHPEWQMMALVDGSVQPWRGAGGNTWFVNPLDAEARAYQLAIVEELLQGYDFDGLLLDWVRFDDWPMDLSETSRAHHQAHGGAESIHFGPRRRIPTSTSGSANSAPVEPALPHPQPSSMKMRSRSPLST